MRYIYLKVMRYIYFKKQDTELYIPHDFSYIKLYQINSKEVNQDGMLRV